MTGVTCDKIIYILKLYTLNSSNIATLIIDDGESMYNMTTDKLTLTVPVH